MKYTPFKLKSDNRYSGMYNITIGIVILGFFLTTHALAKQNPDELYRLGQYAEAEKAYAQLDMDHPKEIRFRYNRGCSAYQEGDYQSAMAAFSSVFKRADTDETRFRANFNMGNTAFRQDDFQAAAHYFKQAIRYTPQSSDARYNLELALKALKEQKNKQNQSGKAENKNTQQEKGKENKKSQNRSEDKKSDEKSQKNHQEEKKEGSSDNKNQNNKKQNQEKNTQSTQKQETPQDISGKLKASQPTDKKNSQGDKSDQARTMINRKKAEALLDNIQESHSRFFQFYIPEEKKQGVESGKYW